MALTPLARRAIGLASAICLLATLSACAPEDDDSVPTAADPFAAVSSATILGPVALNTHVSSDGKQFVLLGVEIKPAGANRLGNILNVNPPVPFRAAQPGHRYVHAVLGIGDWGSGTNLEGSWPSELPEPFVVADGVRFEVFDFMPFGGSEPEKVIEFELPSEARDVVMYVPAGQDSTEIVSFRLW
jgi:hypothetical protein